MANRSPEVDAYIAARAEFARPILEKIRALFHKACPAIEETMKWGFPHFEHMGIVGSMAGFTQHVGFGFWKGTLLSDANGLLKQMGVTSMGNIKVTSLKELPADKVILAYIREAVTLNELGVKAPVPKKKPKPELVVPDDLLAALKKNKKAQATFDSFPPSHKREYVEWITEARQPATRERRLATTLEWLTAGKPRHWKYQKK